MINDYFTDYVVVCTPTRDEWDQTTWTFTEYECRVDRYDKTLNINGESRQASWKLMMNFNAAVDADSRIYIGRITDLELPGSSQTSYSSGATYSLPDQVYQVMRYFPAKGFDSSHLEVWL
jgi:hypothetical protein